MSDVVSVIEEYQVLFCRLYRQAVMPGKGVINHFRSHQVKRQLFIDIRAYHEDMPYVDPVNDALLADRSRPVAELPVFEGLATRSAVT